MDAPLYPRAEGYDEPRLAQTEFGIDDVSVGDLLRSDATRAILEQEIPGLGNLVRAVPQLYATVTNVTLRKLSTFSFFSGFMKKGALERIDARLRALPVRDWPGL